MTDQPGDAPEPPATSGDADWEPSETNCRDALDRVYAYLDGEIDDQDYTRIREHLDDCAPVPTAVRHRAGGQDPGRPVLRIRDRLD